MAGDGGEAAQRRLPLPQRSPIPSAARPQLEPVAAAALELGFRTRWGRMVLEVLPPVDASKGTAVRALLAESGLARALYAGDDTTDLDGFAALDGLEAAVRVAVVSTEGPAELGERADLVRRVDRRRSPSCSQLGSRGRAARAAGATGGARRRARSSPRPRAAGGTGPARRGARRRPCRG